MLNQSKLLILIVSSIFLFQCAKEMDDPNKEQLIKDKKIISDYVASNNLQGVYLQDIFKSTYLEGAGTQYPKINEALVLGYVLQLLDGTRIDSTISFYQHGQFFYPEGWEIAIQSMKEGEEAGFILPSAYGYGRETTQQGNVIIPANSILRLHTKLFDIVPTESIPESFAAFKNITNGKKTESGLYYSITPEGVGPAAEAGKTVTIKYKGQLLNGYTFDERSEYVFVAGGSGFIKGWNEAVSLMKKGDKGFFILPSELGYGVNGSARNNKLIIPPNAVITFELEILDVQ